MPVQEITIVGLGLIGGSLGKALVKKQPALKVGGVDVSQGIIEEAVNRKIINWGTVNIGEGVGKADLVFLATPMPAMARVCREMAPFLKPGAIVTDVGSTKENVVNLMREELPSTVHFIGGHPMAGSEKGGLYGASELLFENAAYILTPTAETDPEVVNRVRNVVESLGARTMLMTPGDHDRKVAAISHLPHLIAGALVNTVGVLEAEEEGYFSLAAGGFRDTTRIAASNSEMWCDIMLQNEKAILSMIRKFRHSLQEFENALAQRNSEHLLSLLAKARAWREMVPTGMKGILPHLFELSVTVPDQPGIIGEISRLLGERRINIIDIEIQRVREEDEGTIRLGFTAEEDRESACEILAKNGFHVQKSRV